MKEEPNSWQEWSQYVLKELERLNELYTKLDEKVNKLDEKVNKIRVEIGMLKVKAGVWGFAGASGAFVIGLAIYLIPRLVK